MTAIIAGISTWFNAYASLDAVGGPWITGAPDKATYPYCVIQDNGGPIARHFGGDKVKTCNVRMTIYHTDEATCRTYQDALHTRFDETKFTLSSGTVLSCLLTNDRLVLGGFDKNNEAVYQAISEFKIEVQV